MFPWQLYRKNKDHGGKGEPLGVIWADTKDEALKLAAEKYGLPSEDMVAVGAR